MTKYKVGDRVRISKTIEKYVYCDYEAPKPNPGIVPEMVQYIGRICTIFIIDKRNETYPSCFFRLKEVPFWWSDWQVEDAKKIPLLMNTE